MKLFIICVLTPFFALAEVTTNQSSPEWVKALRSGESRLKIERDGKYFFRSLVNSPNASQDEACQKSIDRNIENIKKNYPYADKIPLTIEVVFYNKKFKDCATTISISKNILSKIESINAIKKNFTKHINSLNNNIKKLQTEKNILSKSSSTKAKNLEKQIKLLKKEFENKKKNADGETVKLLSKVQALRERNQTLYSQIKANAQTSDAIKEYEDKFLTKSEDLNSYLDSVKSRIQIKMGKSKILGNLFTEEKSMMNGKFSKLIHGMKLNEVLNIFNNIPLSRGERGGNLWKYEKMEEATNPTKEPKPHFKFDAFLTFKCQPTSKPSYDLSCYAISVDQHPLYDQKEKRLSRFACFGDSSLLNEKNVLVTVCNKRWGSKSPIVMRNNGDLATYQAKCSIMTAENKKIHFAHYCDPVLHDWE
jgi:hypothetical protein